MLGIKVGIGSSAFKATSHTETTEAVGSNLVAKGDMQITAKKDMGMKGSTRQKHLPMSDSQGGVFFILLLSSVPAADRYGSPRCLP